MSCELSLLEQETVFIYNQGEAFCTVSTCDQRMKRRLRKLAGKYPEVFIFDERRSREGPTEFWRFPKRLISVRAPYSEERKMHDREVALRQERRPPMRRKRNE